ncbi:hypothetical protein COD94_22265 [Bacillus cereus]|nr:hypothetical protein COD94_22265 [Bacillus cereus]
MKKAGYIAILLFSISFQLSFELQSYQFCLLSNYHKSVILSKSNAEINKTAPFIGTAVQITCAGGRIKWLKMFSLSSMDNDFYVYT